MRITQNLILQFKKSLTYSCNVFQCRVGCLLSGSRNLRHYPGAEPVLSLGLHEGDADAQHQGAGHDKHHDPEGNMNRLQLVLGSQNNGQELLSNTQTHGKFCMVKIVNSIVEQGHVWKMMFEVIR